MKHSIKNIRLIVCACILLVALASILLNLGLGTFSAFGIEDIILLCPLGSLESMLASKSIIPAAVVSFMVAATICALLGKVFCSWICPSALIREFLHDRRAKKPASAKRTEDSNAANSITACDKETQNTEQAVDTVSNSKRRRFLDSRIVVLIGALASAGICGFPVFCLICPIGLLLGTFVLMFQFFGGIANVSIELIVFPAVIIVELVFCKTWCTKFCPLGALLSLLSRPNKMLRPHVDSTLCLNSSSSNKCNKCEKACMEHLDPHSSSGMHDCSKCGRCSDVCPVRAISFIKKKSSREIE